MMQQFALLCQQKLNTQKKFSVVNCCTNCQHTLIHTLGVINFCDKLVISERVSGGILGLKEILGNEKGDFEGFSVIFLCFLLL